MFAQEEARRWVLAHYEAEVEAEGAGRSEFREIVACMVEAEAALACLAQVLVSPVGMPSQARLVAEHIGSEEVVSSEVDAVNWERSSSRYCSNCTGRSYCHVAPSMKSFVESPRRLGNWFW